MPFLCDFWKEEQTMFNLIDEFIQYCRLQANYSQATIRTYKYNLAEFITWYKNLFPKITCINLNFNHWEQFIQYLRDKHLSDTSIRLKISIVKLFFNFLNKIYPEKHIFPPNIPNYRTKRKIPAIFTEIELKKLIDVAQKQNVDMNISVATAGYRQKKKRLHKLLNNSLRDLLIIELFAATGLRVSELCNINLSDVNIEDKSIKIVGKGNRERIIFFDIAPLEETFIAYVNWRKNLKITEQYLFLNSRDMKKISTRSVESIIKKYLKLAELDTRLTPHSIRHSYVTISIEKGANIKAVSQLIGHANVKTTLDMYTHLSKEHLRKMFKLCHPFNPEPLPLQEVIENRKQIINYI